MEPSQEQWRALKAIFTAAVELPPDRRAAFVKEACEGDETLLRLVHRMLAAHETAGDFLEPATLNLRQIFDAATAADERVGTSIGPYRLQRLIGRGGMGLVYLAVREDEAFRKRCALKIVKRGMDTDEIIRRFQNERQTLAALDHPYIARLYDGGTTEDGLPYFVMEYVEGLPIDEYCDVHRLPIEARLRLFCKVCEAVHYAHQNLIVHRDIKPGNILVTENGEPRLLDFGIAKLLRPELTAQSIRFTRSHMHLMTPEYASPEQIRGLPITTASDVYSLGVVLYELLTGHRPYELATRSPSEIERVVCETEPQPPSVVVTRPAVIYRPDGGFRQISPETLSYLRELPPARLRRRLSGDLDAILLTSLRKEPRRRYASAEQFAADIDRHLRGVPILARRDESWYRFGKFVRRHWRGVTAMLAILLFLGSGLVLLSRQAKVIARERDRARLQARKAKAVREFMQAMIAAADPLRSGAALTVADVLKHSGEQAQQELAGQPEIQAAVFMTLGQTHTSLGQYEQADWYLSRSLKLLRNLSAASAEDLPEVLQSLGVLRR